MDRKIKPNFVRFITEYEHSIITPGFPRALDRNHLQSKDRNHLQSSCSWVAIDL